MSVPANHYADTGGVRKTRFKELGYVNFKCQGSSFWQHVARNGDGTVSQVGPRYPSEKQLLADHERYAASYGCDGANKPDDKPIVEWSEMSAKTPVDHSMLNDDHRGLAEDIRAHVWTTFDSRIEFNAEDIGKIAHRAEMAVLDALVELGYGKN